jgi:Ca2+-binding EF-hand superfamily protein
MTKTWMTAALLASLGVWTASTAWADDSQDQSNDQNPSRSSRNDDRDRGSSRDSQPDSRSGRSGRSDSQRQQQSGSNQRSQSGNNGQSGVQGFIQRHDRDGDGYLSKQEMPQDMRGDFDRLDRDSDGYLSRQELQRHAQQAQGGTPVEVTYVWVLDADAGNLSVSDIQDAYNELQKMDKDGDGKITRQELQSRREQVVGKWCDKCFDRLDSNNDGELSQSEAQNSEFANDFQEFDRNSDGSLTKSEIHRTMHDRFQSQSASRQNRQNSSDDQRR